MLFRVSRTGADTAICRGVPMRDLDAPYVFVDPGVHYCGVAWFAHREMYRAEYRPIQKPLLVCGPFWGDLRAVCERPKVYSEEAQARAGRRIRSKDIEDLLLAAGRMTGNLPTEYLYPAQWKGSAKKAPMHARMERALDAEERLVLVRALTDVPKSVHHNVYDAVCMGLKYLGRW